MVFGAKVPSIRDGVGCGNSGVLGCREAAGEMCVRGEPRPDPRKSSERLWGGWEQAGPSTAQLSAQEAGHSSGSGWSWCPQSCAAGTRVTAPAQRLTHTHPLVTVLHAGSEPGLGSRAQTRPHCGPQEKGDHTGTHLDTLCWLLGWPGRCQ